MEPVIGLDVSKGMSVFQPFVQRNDPLGKAETILHEEQGFRRIREVVAQLQERTGKAPVVVLEATGHYHRGLVAFLIREEIAHLIVNPLQSKRARGTTLRKLKQMQQMLGTWLKCSTVVI